MKTSSNNDPSYANIIIKCDLAKFTSYINNHKILCNIFLFDLKFLQNSPKKT